MGPILMLFKWIVYKDGKFYISTLKEDKGTDIIIIDENIDQTINLY